MMADCVDEKLPNSPVPLLITVWLCVQMVTPSVYNTRLPCASAMDAQPSQVFIWLAGSDTGDPLLKSIPALEPKYQMFASPWAVAAKTIRQPKMVESSVFKASWVMSSSARRARVFQYASNVGQ